MNEDIPQTDPVAGYQENAAEIDAAVARVLASGRYLLGPETEAFEVEFAAWAGARECATAASGTEALHLALRACGIGPGAEVITVSHTAVATVSAIELCGARPVLLDVEPAGMTLDPTMLENALTARTRAVVPVHLYGQAADLSAIAAFCRQYGLRLIEDCAQAHGATFAGQPVGTFGEAAAWSFYPTKNLGALGDGGAVTTNNPDVASGVRALRQYGWRERRYVSGEPGWNGRMDEIQAAILRVKLRQLARDNERRRALAVLYAEALAGLPGLGLPFEKPGRRHVWHQYVARCTEGRRDEVMAGLKDAGVQTLVHYPVPIHLQPAYAGRGLTTGALSETEIAASEVLSLPMYPQLGQDAVGRVCDTLTRIVTERRRRA